MSRFLVFSKANLARCEKCGFVTTEGRMRKLGYDSAKNTIRWVCKAERACQKRQQKGAA